MIDTQAALNIGQCSIPEVEEWLNTEAEQRNNQHAIDPLLGCSRKLPKLMASSPMARNIHNVEVVLSHFAVGSGSHLQVVEKRELGPA